MNDIVQRVLVDVPVGASPAGGACSVATVLMLDNGKSDRPAGSRKYLSEFNITSLRK
jgi:hypothetical protein